MEPLVFAVDRIKAFGRSTQMFVKGVLQRCRKQSNQNPIEILKRLQREAFSDLMKLRDRQDKVERILSFYKTGKGGPFQDASTHIKGLINGDCALTFLEDDYQLACDNLDRSGAKRGIDLRFTFETPINQRDLLVAEFLAGPYGFTDQNNANLALAKLMYLANVYDWLSAALVPIGAQCMDFGAPTSQQGTKRGRRSSFWPPQFQQCQSCGIGFTVKDSTIAASLAGLVSGTREKDSSVDYIDLSTFFQVLYQPSQEARLAMSAVWRCRSSTQHLKLGPIALPPSNSKQGTSSSTPSKGVDVSTQASIALMLESQLDGGTNLDGWIEMWKSCPGGLKWGVSLSDSPDDELGWGLKMGGHSEGHFKQLWMEGFLTFNLGDKAVLQPGILYMVNGNSRTPALLLRSSWFM
ncbi:hypothetical protein AXF42_Ash016206 [Apostasia shenzhenica]|uniref:Uncharacterized protein n=1 Tax=Apostasia shenzhenica TaxID=1088818 RepID=A0A2I0AER8_9ASPA|nr:hypothetical protein AXF42_Ash016206 [Apostasia shenzhenica]